MSPLDAPRGIDDSDGELLARLSTGLDRYEAIPERARQQAYSAVLMAAVDAEIAQLMFDSHAGLAGSFRRSGGESEARLLTFSNDHVTIELSLTADRRVIVGEIHPPEASRLTVEYRNGEATAVAIDEFGRFRGEATDTPFRLRIAGQLVTPWIEHPPRPTDDE